MSKMPDPLIADREFFKALTEGDHESLNRLLADEFVLIDVMRGAEVTKTLLVDALRSGQLKFESITVVDAHFRRYGSTAIIIGQTEMRMRFEQASITVKSRYTHVYAEGEGRWRMVSAQGTQISDT